MAESTSRREFLKKSGTAAACVGVGLPVLASMGCGHPKPHEGFRWAMVIDLQKCNSGGGCTECIDRCHEVHNVPEIKDEDGKVSEKEEIKWIWKEPFVKAFPSQEQAHMKEGLREMPSLVLCNHCENPPCVRVCPTQATWKRDDGIVMMDMHRCIGCRYCIVGCPYGSRSFNFSDPRQHLDEDEIVTSYPTRTKGVVEKCNGCAERLAKGQEPACATVCREKGHGAIMFGDLNDPDPDPEHDVRGELNSRYTLRRKPGLGTHPHIFYVV